MRAWTALAWVLAACTRPQPGAAEAGALDASPETSSGVDAGSLKPDAQPAPSVSASAPVAVVPAVPPGEAKRGSVARLSDEPLLRAQLATLRDHFGEAAHGPFAVQTIQRMGGGSAVLVTRADESDPIVLALDRDRLVFAKKRPTGGIVPPAAHVTIAPGPERGVALFAWVASLRLVAGRMWADDSNAYAEIVVMKTDACDALSVAYAGDMGWVVVCASQDGTRAQRLQENLTSAWGDEGIRVGAMGPAGRATLAFDGPASWTLQQRVVGVRGERSETFRYDADGQALSAIKKPSP